MNGKGDFVTVRHKITATAVGIAGLTAAGLLVAGPSANAATNPAVGTAASPAISTACSPTPFGIQCNYWGQSYNGAHGGEGGWVPDFKPNEKYPNNGTGAGQGIWNNNGSNVNEDTKCSPTIYFDPNYSGPSVTFNLNGTGVYRRAGTQLGSLLNNIRSQSWSC